MGADSAVEGCKHTYKGVPQVSVQSCILLRIPKQGLDMSKLLLGLHYSSLQLSVSSSGRKGHVLTDSAEGNYTDEKHGDCPNKYVMI